MNCVLNKRSLDRNRCCVRLHHHMKDLGMYCSVEYPHSVMACTKPVTHLSYIMLILKGKNLLYHVRLYSVTTYSNTVNGLNLQFKRNDENGTRLSQWILCP